MMEKNCPLSHLVFRTVVGLHGVTSTTEFNVPKIIAFIFGSLHDNSFCDWPGITGTQLSGAVSVRFSFYLIMTVRKLRSHEKGIKIRQRLERHGTMLFNNPLIRTPAGGDKAGGIG